VAAGGPADLGGLGSRSDGARRARLDDASQADEAGGDACPHRMVGSDLAEVVEVVTVAIPVGVTLTQDRFGHQVLFVHGGLLLMS
jgi:hypothetical protein